MKTYNIYYRGSYIGYVKAENDMDALEKAITKVIFSNGQCDKTEVRVEKSFL